MKKATKTPTKKSTTVAAAKRSSTYTKSIEAKRVPKKETMSKQSNVVEDIDQDIDEDLELSAVSNSAPMTNGRKALFVVVGLLLLASLAVYRYRYIFTPAVVNGKPIYVWDYFWKLHTQFGKDQLNSMATEEVIRQAVADAKVDVAKEDIDKEIDGIEKEASSSGGVNAILEAQHITMDELRDRIRLQLSVKKILADKISVTDQEVEDTFKKNKDFYKGVPEAQAKETVRKQLEDQKFQTQVGDWLADVRAKAKVEIKFPGI